MKNCPSVFWIGLVSLTAATIYFGAAGNTASAGDTTATNAPSVIVPAAPASTAGQAPALPFGVTEVVKMHQGGIGKDVIENYINNTVLPFHLTADGIIYLQTLGVPQEITRTLILRDGQLQAQAMQYQQIQQQQYQQQQYQQQQYQQQMAATAGGQAGGGAMAQEPPPVVTPSSPAPQVVYATPDYPVYDYGYPYYGYPNYWPGVVIGGGWGWGWGWGGHYGWGGRGGRGGGGRGGGGGGGHGGGHR